SGVDTIEYQVDDTGWKNYTDPVVVDEVGDHTIGYRATDNAGNTSEPKTDPFTIVKDDGKDTAPPKVDVMLHGDTNNDGGFVGSAEVMVNATDADSGVDKVEYKLDDGDWQAYADPFKVDKTGEHTVQARATDKAGNTSDPVQQKFTVVEGPDDDTEAPTVNAVMQGSQDAQWNYIGPVTVKVTAKDAGSGVDKIQYKQGDGEWQAYKEPVKVEGEGDHAVSYRATDAAGNTSKAKQVTFTIIAELPEPPACLDPDPSPKVVMGDIGTGVRNRNANGNCTIDDLVHDEARWANHAPFVRHAKSVLGDLREQGIVTRAERRKILSAARRSDVGRR
ncbi:MAG: Ig-like domain repeat protein, partial [Actinomycetia bacterium]|nr:Ig-like domain repeat protein [Actinomycetes bacterium]